MSDDTTATDAAAAPEEEAAPVDEKTMKAKKR